MMKRAGVGITVLAIAATSGVAQAQPDGEGANAVIPWAYTLNAETPAGGARPDPSEVLQVPGSDVRFRRSELRNLFNPPDWHPDNHPAMPPVVARGREPDVRACGFCHLPNGQGRPENASLSGQPVEYLVQQMGTTATGCGGAVNRTWGRPD